MRTLILVVALTSPVSAQSEAPASLATARELYASADYRGALDMLDGLAAGKPATPDHQSIDLYRTFCLIALGRTSEADETIAAMIARDPLFRPSDAEIPPRLRPLFSGKRKALLPGIIQSRYEQAKESFDRSDFNAALEGFTHVLMVISDPEIAFHVSQPPLASLRVLALGFKDLAVRAIESQAAPAPVPPPAVTTPAPAARASAPPAPESQAPALDAPKVAAPNTLKVYDSNDADVVAPVTVQQDLPQFHRRITQDRIGVLVVVIDETGRVETATVTQSIDSYYDTMLLQSTKTWRYQPATRNGAAVKYRKLVQLTLPRQR
jgi:hypothetical protein